MIVARQAKCSDCGYTWEVDTEGYTDINSGRQIEILSDEWCPECGYEEIELED